MNILYILISFLIFLEQARAWSWNPICMIQECCNADSIIGDLKGLRNDLKTNVYGQHLVSNILLNALQDHIKQPNPQKALTLSFHGWPGIGKNYVVKFIVNSLYKKGSLSKYVHQYTAKAHFPVKELAEEYSRQLFTDIKSKLAECPKQIFIFDEVDKMPSGVLGGITPILDTHEFIDKIDFRQAIYIFISNTGGKLIADRLYELNNQGLVRDEVELYHFEHLIRLGAYNEKGGLNLWRDYISPAVQKVISLTIPSYGGLQYSDSISSNLIDHYIPFLPLERKHVVQCIETEFKRRKFEPYADFIDEIMEYVTFDSNGNGYFATTGCKRIDQKVGTVVQRERHKRTRKNEL